MKTKIREMKIEDYNFVMKMWKQIEGICLSDADSKEKIDRYLKRNPGLSFVAEKNKNIVGTILCGHDGRRGYIHHLAVKQKYRNQGLGRDLVQKSLGKLKEIDIEKCHLFVFVDNNQAQNFWKNIGWEKRNDLFVFSKYV